MASSKARSTARSARTAAAVSATPTSRAVSKPARQAEPEPEPIEDDEVFEPEQKKRPSGQPLWLQLVSFALWSGVTVAIGKRWYRDYPVASSDPQLNDRAARLIGQVVVVSDAIIGGAGRVRVGDGTWSASGPDLAAGASARIVGIAGSTLLVEPVDRLPPA